MSINFSSNLIGSLTCVLSLAFVSCEKTTSDITQSGKMPGILSASPTTGPFGTIDTIIGNNFTATSIVKFNGVPATISSQKEDTLIVIVPKKAGTGNITVANKTDSAVGPVFNYIFTYTVTTFAGNNTAAPAFADIDGLGTAARFGIISSIAINSKDEIYVSEANILGMASVIRKISPSGMVSTVAGGFVGYKDGKGREAGFDGPCGLSFDLDGNLIIPDIVEGRVRKMTPDGVVTTLAGDGTRVFKDGRAAQAGFFGPDGSASDSKGNIYISDLPSRIRKISPDGMVTTYAGSATLGSGDGPLLTATLNYPSPIASDGHDNFFFGTDGTEIREMSNGLISTIAGTTQGRTGVFDGPADQAEIISVNGLVVDPSGIIYLTDNTYNVVSMISADHTHYKQIFGSGTATGSDAVNLKASIASPFTIALDSKGNLFLGSNDNLVRKIIIE